MRKVRLNMSNEFNSRPKIKVEKTNLERLLEIGAFVAVVMMWIYLFLFWASIPERIATHFATLGGQPDDWGSKDTLLAMPIICTLLYLLIAILAQFPQIYNYNGIKITGENAEYQYKNARTLMLWMAVEIVVLFIYIEWGFVQVALGNSKSFGLWFLPIFLVALFGTLAYYIRKMYKLK